MAVVRGLLVVSEYFVGRLQVLTPKGVPLQVLTIGVGLTGVCADEARVWVANSMSHKVRALKHSTEMSLP